MKKIKYLLLLVAMILVIPFAVNAEGEEVTTTASDDSKKVTVYFFRGEGCSHCAEAIEWFNSIQEEYGDKFVIKDYETWYDEDNAALMKKVAKARGEEERATGVPYIIIADQSWVGFDSEQYAPEILNKIETVYAQDPKDRYDVEAIINGKEEKEDSSKDVVALIIILVVVAAGCFGIYKARQKTN